MPETITYKTDQGVYEIPPEKKDSFLKSFPEAEEVESFTIGKDTFDIPVSKVSAFREAKPKAKPLKKKEDLEVSGTDFQFQETDLTSTLPTEEKPPEGFRVAARKKEGLVDPLETEVVVETFDAADEEKIISFQEEERKKREKRRTEYQQLLDESIPPLENRLEEITRQMNIKMEELKPLWAARKDSPQAEKAMQFVSDELTELEKQHDYLMDARDLLTKSKKFVDTSDSGVLKSMFQGTLAKDFFSLGISEIERDADVLKIANKIKRGETPTEEEKLALYARGLNQLIRSDVEQGLGNMVGEGIVETIPFMVQLALTGPLSAGGKTAAKKAVTGTLKKMSKNKLGKLTATALADITGAAVRTPGMIDFYSGVTERMVGEIQPEVTKDGIPTGKFIEETQLTPWEATKKSFASTLATVLIEDMGRYGNSLLNKVKPKISNNAMAQKIGNNTIDQVKDAVSFQGFISEYGEEIVDSYVQSALEGEYRLKEIYSPKELLATGLTVASISGTFSGANIALRGMTQERPQAVSELRFAQSEIKPETAVEIDNILKGDDIDKNAEQLDTYIKKKLAEGATREDVYKIQDYAIQKTRMDALGESEQTIQEEVVKDVQEPKELVQEEKTVEVKEEVKKEEEVAEKPSEIEVEPIKKEKDGVRKQKEIQKESQEKDDEVRTREESRREEVEKIDVEEEVLEVKPETQEGVAEEVTPERVEVKEPVSVDEAESNIQMLQGEKSSLEETLKEVPEDQKQKIEGEIRFIDSQIQIQENYAKEIREKAQERGAEKRVEGKEGESVRVRNLEKDRVEAEPAEKEVAPPILPKTSRKFIQSKAKESIKKIGDVTKKKPIKLMQEAQSIAEIDYLYDLYRGEVPFKDYSLIKAKLRDQKLFDDDTNRISEISSQVLEERAKKMDQAFEEEVGSDRYAELKKKRAKEIDKINDALANIANVKRAVGDGKKKDLGKEFVQLAKSLANVGMIDIELGTKAVMAKIKKFLERYAAEKAPLVDKYENLIAQSLGTREVDKEIAEMDVVSINKRASERIEKRKQTEQKINEDRKKPVRDTMRRLFVDESEPFKVALLKKGGPLARKAVDYFNTQSGMSGRSLSEFNTARKKILGSSNQLLDKDEQTALEEYLTYKRIIELDKLYDKRKENRLQHEGGVNLEEAEIILGSLQRNNKEALEAHGINKEIDWDKIDQRAQAYWDVMKQKLTDLYENGLISKEVYNNLIEEQSHYTPRRYLEHFIDRVDGGGSISGIEALSGGSTGSVLTDIQTLLADVISRANSIIAQNKTRQSLHDVAQETPNDVILPGVYTETQTIEGKEVLGYLDKLKKEEKRLEKLRKKLKKEGRSAQEIHEYLEAEQRYIEPEFQKAPVGYTTYRFNKNGVTNAIYINNDYVGDFDKTSDPAWMTHLKNGLSWVSGNKILKAFATGYNPEFAIKNLPLDMLHIMTTTEAYNPTYLVATAQLASDIKDVTKDAFSRKGRYKDFVEEGGSLEYLSTQGSLTPKKFKQYNKWTIGARALADGAAYLGNTSEIITRLALRERMIKNLSRDFKKVNNREPNKNELKDIQREATAYARNYLDFAQGGKAIKFMNSVIPYLNAGFQVTRGTLRAVQRNPKVFWYKMGQLGATAAAITAYNLGMYPTDDEEKAQERKQYYLNDISERRKADNFIIMTNLSYMKNDKKHFVYFAFPKDNAQKTITGWVEGSLAAMTGEKGQLLNERRWMEVQALIQNVADLGNLPPIQSAILGSQLNKDLFYRTDIWSGRDLGKYKSQEFNPNVTPQRFIKAGEWSEKVSEALGFEASFSPVRMQYFMSQFTTKSNVISTLMGEALDVGVAGLDSETEEIVNRTMGERLVTAPFSRRFFKKTSPYVKSSPATEEQQKLNALRQRNDNKFKPLLKEKEYGKILDLILSQEDPYEMQRLLGKLQDEVTKIGGIDYRIRELSFAPAKARANAFYRMWMEADKEGKKNLMEGSVFLGFFNSDEFKFQIVQLMREDPDFSLQIPE